jgi:T-complex protein 1 subunit zeta
LEVAKRAVLEFLDKFKTPVNGAEDRETLRMVARTSLRTKLSEKLADQLTDIVTDAVLAIRKPGEPIDLFMVCLLRLKLRMQACCLCGVTQQQPCTATPSM